MLIDDFFIPKELKQGPLYKKYQYIKNLYDSGHTYVIFNNTKVFEPWPIIHEIGDICDLQKIVIYNSELRNLNNWIMSRIVINLGNLDHKTMGVLTRIATGMLNKINVDKIDASILHYNMVTNIRLEYERCILSELPF